MIPSRANLGVLAGIAFAAFALPISLEAQAVPADTVPRPRVGLALSGGAARGFAHAGVIEVLEGAGVPVDAIAGTSMGSVIGGLYASGFSTSQLRAVTAQVDWDRMFSDEPDRRNLPMERKTEAGRTLVTLPVREGLPRLPSSILTGQRISQLLAGLTWHVHPIDDFRDLPIPFVALATDVETGEAVVLDHGFLADAIRASLAIPSLFAPVQIDGRFLIDGGIARNLPSPDAADLGADIVICSDVTEPLAPADSLVSLLDILNQTISFRMVERRNRDAERCDILIQPDIEGIASADFGRAEAIVERGRAAARAALDSLRALGITGRAEPSGRATRKPVSDRVHVQAVRVSGLRRTPEGTLRGSLELRTPAVLSVRDVNEAVTRVYDTGLFQRVSYRLDPVPAADPSGASPDSAARVLVVDVEDEGRDWVGASYRYEGRYKASILATAALRNLLLNGTTLLADLRLGEQTRVAAEFQRRSGWDLAPLVLLRGEWKRSPFDLYEDGRRVSDPRVRVGLVEAFAGAGRSTPPCPASRGWIRAIASRFRAVAWPSWARRSGPRERCGAATSSRTTCWIWMRRFPSRGSCPCACGPRRARPTAPIFRRPTCSSSAARTTSTCTPTATSASPGCGSRSVGDSTCRRRCSERSGSFCRTCSRWDS
jgi:NTE family protein